MLIAVGNGVGILLASIGTVGALVALICRRNAFRWHALPVWLIVIGLATPSMLQLMFKLAVVLHVFD